MKRFVMVLSLGSSLSLNGWAQGIPFTYQGLLMESNRPATGLYDVMARLRDAPTGGNQVPGTPVLNLPGVAVTNGLFTVMLDFRANAFDGSIRWLELSLRANGANDFITLLPAQAITPAPFAGFARSAAAAATVSNGVYLTGTYTNPSWLASIGADKITGQISDANLSSNVALLSRNLPFGNPGQGSPLQGWIISTPYSRSEPPARTLRFKAGGNQGGEVDGVTGDGYIQVESNFNTSNSVWLNWEGSIYSSRTNDFFKKLPILVSTVTRSLSDPVIRIGANTNLQSGILINRAGVSLYIGAADFTSSTNGFASRSTIVVAGTLFSSTTPAANAGPGETDLLQAVIPACALTNSQDTITFFASGRFSRAANPKQLRLYYGSSLIGDTGPAAQSNLTWTVQGRIVANEDGLTQYVTGSLLWNSIGSYASTNWSLTTSETNGLDALFRITGASDVSSITNELLQLEVRPAPPYTF